MRLNFMQTFPWPDHNGQPIPTYFVEKVQAGLMPNTELHPRARVEGHKLHTIRRVNGRPRYRQGMQLEFTTGPRFKARPFGCGECTGTQLLEMGLVWVPTYGYGIAIDVDGKAMGLAHMQDLARNDGLAWPDFQRWFLLDLLAKGPGTYQLVHWAGMKY